MAWNRKDSLITFDPGQIGEATGNNILRNVCDPLVAFDLKDPAKVVPATAERWTVSPDGLTLTFTCAPICAFPPASRPPRTMPPGRCSAPCGWV